MALADMQSAANGCAWPSLTKLQEYTCLSRNAVIAAIKALEATGVVEADRNDPRHTRYVVKPAAFTPPPLTKARKSRAFTSAPAALPDADQMPPSSAPPALVLVHVKDYRDDSASAPDALPSARGALDLVHGADSLVHGADPNHKEPKTEPKDNHKSDGDVLEGFELSGSTDSKKPKDKNPKGFDPATVDLPEGLDRPLWLRWLADLKARKVSPTAEAVRLQLKRMAGYIAEGLDPVEIIEHSITSSYRSPFKPPGGNSNPRRPASTGRHTGLASKDPSKGIEDDGSFSLPRVSANR